MRIRSTLVALTALPLIVLAACGTDAATAPTPTGSDTAAATTTETATDAPSTDGTEAAPTDSTDTQSTGGTDTQSTDSAAATTAPPAEGPTEPASTVVADPAPKDEMPTVTGAFGETPKLTFPEGKLAPAGLQRQVLTEGTGDTVAAGDLLVANYVGQVWDAETSFDTSFGKPSPAGFTIGKGQVVNGWDVALVGTKVGSRVLLTLPPSDGYGSAGNSQAGILGTDTIVFVVDIVNTFPASSAGQADAKVTNEPPAGITIAGKLGEAPKITIDPKTTEPTANKLTVLATGTGEKIADGKNAVFQVVAQPWDGSTGGSSYADGAVQQAPISAQSILKDLVGVPVGSRVMLLVPATAGDASTGAAAAPSVVYVIDVAGQY